MFSFVCAFFLQNVCIASSNVFCITWKNRKALMGGNNLILIASATQNRTSKQYNGFSTKAILLTLGSWGLVLYSITPILHFQWSYTGIKNKQHNGVKTWDLSLFFSCHKLSKLLGFQFIPIPDNIY